MHYERNETRQAKICAYLNHQKKEIEDLDTATRLMQEVDYPYLIGQEVNPPEHLKEQDTNLSTSKYFRVFYNEIRTDQFFVQIAPMVCQRSGYLKIGQDGSITLLNEHFKPYIASLCFYFDDVERILKTEENMRLVKQERLSSRCVKGVATLGLCSFFAATLYLQSKLEIKEADENEMNLTISKFF